MSGANESSLNRAEAVPAVHGTSTRWLLNILLCTIGLAAIVAVVAATTMGQPTAALVIGLVSAAFFAGMMC